MNIHFLNKVGLLIFIIGAIGLVTGNLENKYLWLYPILLAIGTLLYLMPTEYYEKIKRGKK